MYYHFRQKKMSRKRRHDDDSTTACSLSLHENEDLLPYDIELENNDVINVMFLL